MCYLCMHKTPYFSICGRISRKEFLLRYLLVAFLISLISVCCIFVPFLMLDEFENPDANALDFANFILY